MLNIYRVKYATKDKKRDTIYVVAEDVKSCMELVRGVTNGAPVEAVEDLKPLYVA